MNDKRIDNEIIEFCRWLVDYHNLPKESEITVRANLKLTLNKIYKLSLEIKE